MYKLERGELKGRSEDMHRLTREKQKGTMTEKHLAAPRARPEEKQKRKWMSCGKKTRKLSSSFSHLKPEREGRSRQERSASRSVAKRAWKEGKTLLRSARKERELHDEQVNEGENTKKTRLRLAKGGARRPHLAKKM